MNTVRLVDLKLAKYKMEHGYECDECDSNSETEKAFLAGYSSRDGEVSDLQDKLYHESRKAPEVEYKLNEEIKRLRGALEKAKEGYETLKVAVNDKQPDLGATNFCAKRIDEIDKALKGGTE